MTTTTKAQPKAVTIEQATAALTAAEEKLAAVQAESADVKRRTLTDDPTLTPAQHAEVSTRLEIARDRVTGARQRLDQAHADARQARIDAIRQRLGQLDDRRQRLAAIVDQFAALTAEVHEIVTSRDATIRGAIDDLRAEGIRPGSTEHGISWTESEWTGYSVRVDERTRGFGTASHGFTTASVIAAALERSGVPRGALIGVDHHAPSPTFLNRF